MNSRLVEARVRTRFWRLSLALLLLTFALLALGGLPHAATGSIACSDSPVCHRWALPTDDANGALSAAHRVVAGLVGLGALALAALATTRLRADRRVMLSALAALGLIVVQGGATLAAQRADWGDAVVTAHFGATALLFAVTIWLALLPWIDRQLVATRSLTANVPSSRYTQLLWASTGVVFAVLLSGALASSRPAAPTCAGWPLCGDGAAQLRAGQIDAHMVHRGLVLVAAALLLAVVIATFTHRARPLAARLPVAGMLGVYAVESIVGAALSWGEASATRSALHFAASSLVWGLLVGVTITQETLRRSAADAPAVERQPWRVALRDYLRVTKPGIIVLLLVTTLGAMLLAGPGWPSPWLALATLLGGALASGGAGALNCYFDRDIDVKMARTRKRPIPTGHLTPTQVWRFGLILSALAVVELALLVNLLAAALALAGNLFYVGIYTRWLKRATPQNIVIGGAAGSFPPLVGWAAVTGRLDWGALVLFAIIFYWTPPHFWSLALLKANDYRRAGIPMLPVTAGEHATRRMILLYALLLVAVTLLMGATGVVGPLYLVAALILGGLFVSYAARMYREDSNRLAWPLFKFSNYYLAGLLAIMVIDRALGSL